jgi:hypothetical protein
VTGVRKKDLNVGSGLILQLAPIVEIAKDGAEV